MKHQLRAALSVVVGLLFAFPAYAEEMEMEEADNSKQETFVWLKSPIAQEGEISKKVEQYLKFKPVIYEKFGGFLVPGSSTDAQALVDALGIADQVDRIEEDRLVYGFDADCGDETPIGAELPLTGTGVHRVTKSETAQTSTFTGRVWIVDSGIADDFDSGGNQDLNVQRADSRHCFAGGCTTADNGKDKIGHGTAIAGIIGAMDNDVGVIGIAPGVKLVSLKVFHGRKPVVKLKVIYRALEWIAVNGNPMTDVINISWGTLWDPDPIKANEYKPLKIEEQLKTMARDGFRIAVAAGNIEAVHGSGYVQAMSPARIGTYNNPNDGSVAGGIFTVSSVKSTYAGGGVWTDVFSDFSFFGNKNETGANVGPPDYAVPGEDITSLWPKGNTASCSGTSFAAAHMTGILTIGFPKADTDGGGTLIRAENDLSAIIPDSLIPAAGPIMYDENLKDRIGVIQ